MSTTVTKQQIKDAIGQGLTTQERAFTDRLVEAVFRISDVLRTNDPKVNKQRKADLIANAHRYIQKVITSAEQRILFGQIDLFEDQQSNISDPIIPADPPVNPQ